MAAIPLYDSTICRLCAEDNDNGEMLFTNNSKETELSAMVNRYLPLKVHDDGKLPRTICPGCNIQLEATVQFFELLINGQRKIREMWKQQIELERKCERDRIKQKNINLTLEIEGSSIAEPNEQQIIINVMPDGTMYAAEHDISLQMDGLDKPKRKRGRPPKGSLDEESKETEKDDSGELISAEEEEDKQEEELEGDMRRKRKRKVPRRYMESVQGKELEKIFKDEGVADEDDLHAKYETVEHLHGTGIDSSNSDTEVIGHLESIEGKNLGELVVVNRNKIRSKSKIPKSKIKKKHKFYCSYCGKGFPQRSKYIIHKSLHKTTKYECTDCQNQFSTKDNLALHHKSTGHSGENIIELYDSEKDNTIDSNKSINIEIVNGDKPNLITTDPSALPNEASLNVVEDNEIENNKTDSHVDPLGECSEDAESKEIGNSFKCHNCNKHFQTKEKLDTHIKVVHQGEKPFVCDVCQKAFAYESSLKGHKEIVHEHPKTDKGFPCDICGKILNHPSSVMYHKLTEHNNGRRFVCNKCGKSFKHKQLLQRHQLVHSEDRPYPCKSCDASFKTKANLLNHQSTHTGEKKHYCELCDHKFAHKTSLTLHYRTHTGQKPYKCEVCSKSFSQNGNLQEHMRIHTGEKPYCCDHCGRKFTTSSQFKLHVKRHTGERPWKCEFCAKSFLHKDTWKCHVRRHTGERPFQCAYCNRGFTEQWALKKHLRLHTGEKPYSCEICGKAFADCSNLTKHKKVHKPQDTDLAEGAVEEVWQILPNSHAENVVPINAPRVITTDEVSEDGMSQIIYVAYQDPDHSNESTTLQFDKESILTDQSAAVTNENEVPMNLEFPSDSDLQLQITDESGNTIPLSLQQARQLLTQGHFINQSTENQTIRIQDVQGNLGINSDIHIPVSLKEKALTKNPAPSTIQTDAEAIVKVLEDEDTDATTVAAINQMNAEDRMELNAGQQTIEFITQDGQKVRLVASLNVDQLQLASEYLTIV